MTADVLERRYRRIVTRWYPAAWAAVNGEALIGTLLDDAEHRGGGRIAVRTRLDLARQGVALRAVDALPLEVRTATASISAGIVTAYTLLLVLAGSVPRGNRVSADGSALPLLELSRLLPFTPFLVVWLLVAACAFTPRRRSVLAVLSIAGVVATVVWSPLWYSDALVNPFVFGSVSSLVFLLCAGCAGFLGRARVKPFVLAVLGTSVVAVGMLFLRVTTVEVLWPDWFWIPAQYPAQGVMSTPVIAAIAVIALVLMKTERRRWGLVLAFSAVPGFLGWLTALVLHPVVVIAY